MDNKIIPKDWYLSSQESGDLSLTFKGIIMAFVPLVVSVAATNGIEVAADELVQFISSIFAAIAAIQIVWGAGRKLVNKFKKTDEIK